MLLGVLGLAGNQQGQAQDNTRKTGENVSEAGAIAGTVVGAESGETFIGVNVIIKGTTQGASSDVDGEFRISDVEPGTYTIVASYLSYADYTVKDVEVDAGETTNIDIAMKSQTRELDGVTVTARQVANNEAALLSQRQKSIGFSNAISAESISRSAAGNAAQAMKKVVGATVVEGKYVYVRGLGDRYSETQLNGANLPSADPNKKSFQMDLFPSSMIKNITTVKTFTPDKPGNFTGGLVNVETKDFPDDLTFELSASRSYNTQTSFESILQGNSSNTDFLGFDSGERQIPGEVQDYLTNHENLPRRPTFLTEKTLPQAQQLSQLTESFGNTMAPVLKDVGLNQSYSATLGNQFDLGDDDLGYTASLSYSRSYSGYSNGTSSRYAIRGQDVDSLSPQMQLEDNRGEESVDIGGLVNLSYRFDPNNKISTTFMRTQYGTSVGRSLEGKNYKYLSEQVDFQTRTIHYTERGLTSVQMEGKHYLPGLLKSTVEWNTSYAKNTQDEPDLRYTWNQKFGSYYSIPTNNVSNPPTRYFRDLDESNYTAGLDVSIPFPTHTVSKGKVKFGGTFNSSDRTFRQQRFDYVLPGYGATNLNDVRGDINEFFRHVGLDTTEDGDPVYGLAIRDASSAVGDYDAAKKLYALYGMVEVPLADRLKFSGGLRMEKVDIETISQDTSVAEGHLENTDLLPSLNLTYNVAQNMNIRASYTRTLARPTFRELAPYVTYSFVGDYLYSGNPNLERTLISNYDVRWEWFPNPGEVFSVSGFYKEFQNPLERVIRTDLGNFASSIQNVDRGMVYGAEFEVRKRLDFLGGFMRHFMVSTNLTLVESEVDIPERELTVILGLQTQNMTEEEIEQAIAEAPESVKHRPLSNQSPYAFNFDISYNNPSVGLTADLNYNIFGDRLNQVMRGTTPNSYQRSYGTLNFVGSKKITNNFTLNVSVENILNPDIRETQEYKGVHYVNQSYQEGVTYQIGIKYQL